MYDWFLRIQNVNKDIIYQDKYPQRWACYFDTTTEWDFISWRRKMSENFIERYASKVNWEFIFYFQELSESFIQKTVTCHELSYRSWAYIAKYHNLSKEFILKHAVTWFDIVSDYGTHVECDSDFVSGSDESSLADSGRDFFEELARQQGQANLGAP